MTPTGTGTYGTEAEWQGVIARTRAIPAYLATAESQLAAGLAARNTPDWRMLRDQGLEAPLADADYFSKTLPKLAEADIASAHKDAAALKPEFRADRFALGQQEYDWALHNNLRLEKTSGELYVEAEPIVAQTRDQMVALARELASNHKWKTPADGPAAVRAVFERLSHDAPRNGAESRSQQSRHAGSCRPRGISGPRLALQGLYQLRGKLYRDLRVSIDTGIHTGRLQFEQAVTLFSETVDFLPGNCADPKVLKSADKRASCDGARRAIARYARWPTQAITYRLGMDQIVALRKQAQDKLGTRFSAQHFHLEFMKQGTIPAGYFGTDFLNAF